MIHPVSLFFKAILLSLVGLFKKMVCTCKEEFINFIFIISGDFKSGIFGFSDAAHLFYEIENITTAILEK